MKVKKAGLGFAVVLLLLLSSFALTISSHTASAISLPVDGQDTLCPSPPPRDPSSDVLPEYLGDPVSLGGHIKLNGLPIVGYNVQLDATSVNLWVRGCGFGRGIDLSDLPYAWEVVQRPPQSTSELIDPLSETPSLKLDLYGTFEVSLTVCPSPTGCSIPFENENDRYNVGPFVQDLPIFATLGVVRHPDTLPFLPPSARVNTPLHEDPAVDLKCQGGGGLIKPQWVTVNPWRDSNDYELLEGQVQGSRVSREDNPLNHDYQDVNFVVSPDPQYWFIASKYPADPEVEVEWERNYLPEIFRPTPGDRVSVFGYWIHDCGHSPFNTEIHPPIGIAVQRPRPIAIPSSEGYGSNVYVPGIVTDIWFNRQAGRIDRDYSPFCLDTTLHQPAHRSPVGLIIQGDCIRAPSPLNRVFEFNIYLPRDPQAIVAEVGRVAPAVTLHYEVLGHPYLSNDDAPDPQIQIVNDSGVTYLKVRLDFSSIDDAKITYSRRIVAGWIYPAPDNWGLERWKLRLNSIEVHNDGDGVGRGDGEWRFWINTNNRDKEWTKLIEGDVDDGDCCKFVNFEGRPWETGSPGPDRDLGPDLLVYPRVRQRIWVHTSGYEDDDFWDDDTGAVNDFFMPTYPRSFSSKSFCIDQSESVVSGPILSDLTYGSGCASYTLHYEILNGNPVGEAHLSQAGLSLFQAYFLGVENELPCVLIGVPDICAILPGVESYSPPWHPNDIMIARGRGPLSVSGLAFLLPQEVNEFSINGITTGNLTTLVSTARRDQPAKVDELMRELRTYIGSALHYLNQDTMAALPYIRDGFPNDLWYTYFGDIDPKPANADPLSSTWQALVDSPLFVLGIIPAALVLGLVLGLRIGRRKRASP